jgi:hypothetical protein
MAYTALTDAEVATGKPTKSSMLTKVKTNLADHENRLQDLEGGLTSSPPPIIFYVPGSAAASYSVSGHLKTVINFNLTITGIRLYVDAAGTSGTHQIDLLYKRAAGGYISVLTTKPSVAYTAGDDAISSNAVLDSGEASLLAGDILRLDIDSLQVEGANFYVRVDYERD